MCLLKLDFDPHSYFISPDLRRQIVFEKVAQLDNAIMKNRDFSCAYVYQEATAQFLLQLTNFFARGTVGNRARIMKEQLCKVIDSFAKF